MARVVLPSPGGVPARPPAPPAPRPTSLEGLRVLLLDNGQVEEQRRRYGDVLDWLAADLTHEVPDLELVRMQHDLVTFSTEQLEALREEMLGTDVAGVVIVICHAGVTAPSSVLACDLERHGLPCVLVCTPLGRGLAETMASYDVPGLPLVDAVPIRELDEARILDGRAATLRSVIAALTTPPERLEEEARASGRGDPAAGVRELMIEVPDGSDLDLLVWEELERLRMTDGLPVVAPTPERVEAMLAATSRPRGTVLLDGPTPSGAPITVEKLAVNAVLAGCRPEYFPVVVAAFEAMADPAFRFFHAVTTTHPGGVAVVVSGPLAKEIGLHAGLGALGPGFRANATIGRVVSLALINIARAVPGRSSLATHGSPAQYAYCFAEAEDSPWPPVHGDAFPPGTTTVTVLKCEAPHNVFSHHGSAPEGLLRSAASVAATTGSNAVRWPCEHLVVVNPAQAQIMADAGWTKERVQSFLFEEARIPADSFPYAQYRSARPEWTWHLERVPVVNDPSEFLVVVAGGIGAQLMVALPWGLSRAVTRAVVP